MKHPFQHLGVSRQLVKHPGMVAKLRAGKITAAELERAPWYFRLTHAGNRTMRCTGTPITTDAVAIVKRWLTAARQQPDRFSAALQSTSRDGSTTVGQLAQRWIDAGMPDDSGCPRTPRQQDGIRHFLQMALRWWGDRRVGGIRPLHLQEYADHRRSNTRHGTGERSVDLELIALSHVCSWAKLRELCEHNPFQDRPRFRKPAHVAHAHEHMPRSTAELHAILAILMSDPDPTKVVAGAHLCFCALTGLRPGEPGALLCDPIRGRASVTAGEHYPGERYTVTAADGHESMRMAVARLKGGQNPAVAIHPALDDFLTCWEAWCCAHLATRSQWWFPHPGGGRALVPFGTAINRCKLGTWLTAAARSVGAGHLTPHGMRAAYVRVRRSQGADDLTISIELGQGSGPNLVRNVYGDPRGLVGDRAFTFIPATTPPCWEILRSATEMRPANVVAI